MPKTAASESSWSVVFTSGGDGYGEQRAGELREPDEPVEGHRALSPLLVGDAVARRGTLQEAGILSEKMCRTKDRCVRSRRRLANFTRSACRLRLPCFTSPGRLPHLQWRQAPRNRAESPPLSRLPPP